MFTLANARQFRIRRNRLRLRVGASPPICALLTILLLPQGSRGQAPVEVWAQSYGPGSGPNTVAVDGTGNVFMSGNFGTIKYSGSGVPLWTNNFDGQYGRAMALDANGNAFFTGLFLGASGWQSETIKYSMSGTALWTNRYAGWNGTAQMTAVATDPAGNVVVCGGAAGFYATIKYSSSGVALWTNLYLGPAGFSPSGGGDYAQAVAVDSAGNVFVTGSSVGRWYYNNGYWSSSSDYATIKYSSNGVPLWTNRYDGPISGDDFANTIALDANGDALVTGQSQNSYYSFFCGCYQAYYFPLTIKYSNSGASLWTNGLQSANLPTRTSSIAIDSSNNIFVTEFGGGSFLTAKYSSAGAPIWTNIYSGAGADGAFCAAADPSGNVIVLGTSYSGSNLTMIAYSSAGVSLWTNQLPTGGNLNGMNWLNQMVHPLAVTSDSIAVIGGSSVGGYATARFAWPPSVPRAPSPSWQANFGGTNDDILITATPTIDGGFILGGYTSSANASGNKTNPAPSGSVVPVWWVVKTDGKGNKQWERSYGGTGTDSLNAIAQATNSDFFFAGYSSSPANPPTKTVGTYGDRDYWLMRVDMTGNPIWQTNFGGTGTEYGLTMVATSDGGCLVGGHSASPVSGNKTAANYGLHDYWLVKVDGNGNKQWDKSYGGSNYDLLGDHSIQQTSDGGYVVAGASASSASGNKTNANFGSYDYWILKLDGSGNKVWEQEYGGSGDDEPNAVRQTTDGGYIVLGYSTSGATGNKTTGNYGGKDIWILKLDANGNKEWEQDYGGVNDDYVGDIQQTVDGGYLVGSTTYSSASGNLSSTNHGGQDFWLLKLDAFGNKLWESTYGGTNDEILAVVQLLTNNGVLLAGRSQSSTSGNKSVPGYGGQDYWIVKLANDPPSVLAGPQSITNTAGTTANFSVTAIGAATLGYQWRKNSQILSDNGNVTGSATASLSLSSVQTGDAASYDVIITNNYGSATSAIAMLTVVLPPAITSPPQSQTNLPGTAVQFSVTATGTAPLAYQWRKGGTNLSDSANLSGTTGATLSITNAQTSDAGSYDVVVTNNYGSATSAVAILTVWIPPTIAVQPAPQSVALYGGAAFSVTANGTAPLAYQWRKNAAEIPGATGSSLVLNSAQFSDAGQFSVLVTNAVGSVTSTDATLTVTSPQAGDLDLSFNGRSTISGTVVSVALQPDGKLVVGGTFTNVNGLTRNRIARLNSDGSTDATFLNGLAGANGTVRSLALQPDGKVLVGGEFTAVNSVTRGRIARLNADGSLDTGFQNGLAGASDAVYSLALQGDGKLVIGGPFVQVNGTSRGCVARLTTSGSVDTGFLNGLAGADNTIISVSLQTNGQVVIGGAFGSVNGVARGGIARLNTDGSLDTGFQNGSVGANAYVYATAIQNDGRVLLGGDFTTVNSLTRPRIARLNSSGGVDTSFGTSVGANGIVWTIAQLSDGRVLAGGDFTSVNGTTRNRFARLDPSGGVDTTFQSGMAGANNTVYAAAEQTDGKLVIGGSFTSVNGVAAQGIARLWAQSQAPPAIITDPQSQTNVAGSVATFTVAATGTAPLAYQWRKNSQNLSNGGNLSGATSASLVISNVSADAGSYDVIVTNVYGSVTSAVATLTVWYPPVIASQPFNQTNAVGDTAVFSVSASGFTTPIHFEWRRNGTNFFDGGTFPGSAAPTTDSLTLTNVQLSDAASYDVVITNLQGAVTSQVATLTVAQAPSIVTQPQSQTNALGAAASFTASATGTAPLVYQWRKGGVNLADAANLSGSTSTALSLASIQWTDAGSYDVVITNNYGSVTSQVATLTVTTNRLLAGLLAYFPFNGNALDASGNGRDGIVQGAVLTTNRFGQANQAYAFGSTGYIQVNNLNPDDYQSGFSFGLWVYPQAPGGWLFWNYTAGWGATFIQWDDYLHFRIGSGDPSTDHEVTGVTVPFTNWSHLLVTHNPTNDSLYLNGQPVGQWPSRTMQGNVSTLLIGQGYGPGCPGLIDDVVVYGRELAADEVASLYNGGLPENLALAPAISNQPRTRTVPVGTATTLTVGALGTEPLVYQWRKGGTNLSDLGDVSGSGTSVLAITNAQSSDTGAYDVVVTNAYGSVTSQVATLTISTNTLWGGLLAYFPFNGGALDASGNGRDGVVQGAILTTDRFSQANQAYAFSGTNYIQVNNLDPDNYTNGFSFGLWVYPQGQGGWLYWNYDGGWGSTFFQLDSGLHVRIGTGSPATDQSLNSSLTPLNQWTHVFATHNPTNDTVYINGQPVSQWPSSLMQGNVSFLRMGQGYDFGGFTGSIDEVVVYGRELAAGEVMSLYNGGLLTVSPTGAVLSIQQPFIRTNITMSLAGSPGSIWKLDRSLLLSGPWTNIGSVTIGTNNIGLFQDTNPPSGSGFYRARQL